MDYTYSKFSTTYIELSFHLSEILTDSEYDPKLFKSLSEVWNRLEPPNDQGNLTTEVQLLNTRLLLLFFDSEFRKDLKETVTAYGSLLPNQLDNIIALEQKSLEYLTMLLPDKDLDNAERLRKMLKTNWAINFDYRKDNSIILSSFTYGLSEFDLKGHNERLQLILKEHPNLRTEVVRDVRFDGGINHLIEVNLKYSLETNLKLFERKLKELYENQDPHLKRPLTKEEDKFYSPHRISNLFSIQPQHKHFELHEMAFKISLCNPSLRADAVAEILCEELASKDFVAEKNTIAKIIKDLPLITRPFHPKLGITRSIIYNKNAAD